MIPAAFGAITHAVGALDAHLDPATLHHLSDEDLAASWRAASDLCADTDALYQKLKTAYANRIIHASHGKGTAV